MTEVSVVSDLPLEERLSQADGPSRKLDAEIHEKVFGRVWIAPLSGPWLADGSRPVPPYTSSLDEAAKLIPEGYDWMLGKTNDGLTIHACVGSTKEYFAETPALALCVAALMAHSVSEPT